MLIISGLEPVSINHLTRVSLCNRIPATTTVFHVSTFCTKPCVYYSIYGISHEEVRQIYDCVFVYPIGFTGLFKKLSISNEQYRFRMIKNMRFRLRSCSLCQFSSW